MKTDTATPVMKQYWEAKKSHPDSIMLFRMGDFYETFEKDAILTSDILGITLTKRANGGAAKVPLAGFPYHSLEQHLHKLLKAGYRVAICEQVEDPKRAKGIVKREVVEVLSPGTAMSNRYLEQKENNYLCSVVIEKYDCGISILDNSTGDFFTCSRKQSDFSSLIKKFNVSEIIIPENHKNDLHDLLDGDPIFTTTIPDWCSSYDTCYKSLISFFNVATLKGYGIEDDSLAIKSAGCALYYVDLNYKGKIKHITSLSILPKNGIMGLDAFTLRNLEIFQSLSNQGIHGTLVDTVDKTVTACGSRLVRNWLRQPLTDPNKINERLDRISEILLDKEILENIQDQLKETSDIERILARISNGKATPLDIVSLGNSLQIIDKIKKIFPKDFKTIKQLINGFKNTNKIRDSILYTIKADPPVNINKGEYIRDGVSNELDELREILKDASRWMSNMQMEEQKNTNIPSLKIGYNKIFGYYLEVTKAHINKIPEYYIRKQTLTNSERYFTEELKLYEEKILSADEKIFSLETQILDLLQNDILKFAELIQHNAKILAQLDVAASFASVALEKGYSKPIVDNSLHLKIKNGRHPVVEDLLPIGENFIPNDLELENDNIQIAIITGPNMAGKSTYLRQVGLIVILTQIGSYIPAESAHIGVVDQLFTRVGASDNLAGGESTFLVEMNETANILNNATSKSLILLDEIGRGTSTYDGLSIAWAVTEYIHSHKDIQAKTLFATHYHELVSLANQLPRAQNMNVSVKEFGDKVIFLKKIIKGGADKSYGVHVAEMAGLPTVVIERAKELLRHYSQSNNSKISNVSLEIKPQMDLFYKKEAAFKKDLQNIEINDITPMDALNKLNELKKKHGI